MDYCIEKIEDMLEHKLSQLASKYEAKELRVLDIGVFPWHGMIELSLLFEGDNAELDDVAAWPYYNCSNINEGGWDEAKELSLQMNNIWEKERDATPIFLDFASAALSEKVTSAVQKFRLSEDFIIQLLDPDDSESENFCA